MAPASLNAPAMVPSGPGAQGYGLPPVASVAVDGGRGPAGAAAAGPANSAAASSTTLSVTVSRRRSPPTAGRGAPLAVIVAFPARGVAARVVGRGSRSPFP